MNRKTILKIVVDIGMTIMLLLLMTYERIGAAVHEWLGMAMFVLFMLHHFLNRKWSGYIFKGRYTLFRIWQTIFVIGILLTMAGSMKLLTEQTEDGSKRRNAAKKKELEAAEKRIEELSAIFKRLYEDSVTGRISDERFTELSADYEAKQKELKERAAVLQGELSRTLEATANAEKFMKVVRKYTSFEELAPTLLRKFVEKIVIHESEALDGKRRGKLRRQEIEIYYSFVGRVELPDESPTRPAVSRIGNGRIFYTSFTSLSYMSKVAAGITVMV